MDRKIYEKLSIFVWAKDRNFKYIYCNENYARAADLDSPLSIIGKSDDEMPWRAQADYFRRGDAEVFQGNIRLNVQETEIRVDGVADILVSENPLFDKHNHCIGLIGSYIEITGQCLIKKAGYFDPVTKRYYLGPEFNNDYLTGREIQVFKSLLLGHTARQTAALLQLSPKTIEGYLEIIKLKIGVKNKGELIARAIEHGLTQIIYLQN